MPRLLAYEIRTSVLMGVRRIRITQAHEDFLDTLNILPIRLADPPSYDAVFALAGRFAPTVYDSAYLGPGYQRRAAGRDARQCIDPRRRTVKEPVTSLPEKF